MGNDLHFVLTDAMTWLFYKGEKNVNAMLFLRKHFLSSAYCMTDTDVSDHPDTLTYSTYFLITLSDSAILNNKSFGKFPMPIFIH